MYRLFDWIDEKPHRFYLAVTTLSVATVGVIVSMMAF